MNPSSLWDNLLEKVMTFGLGVFVVWLAYMAKRFKDLESKETKDANKERNEELAKITSNVALKPLAELVDEQNKDIKK